MWVREAGESTLLRILWDRPRSPDFVLSNLLFNKKIQNEFDLPVLKRIPLDTEVMSLHFLQTSPQ